MKRYAFDTRSAMRAAVAAALAWGAAGAARAVEPSAPPDAGPAAAEAGADTPWTIAGRQGVVLLVVVPARLARDEGAYQRELQRLCEPERTCFVNFYTNSSGAPITVPLPDAIADEATATFRRSAKQGAERLMWSCRLRLAQDGCF